MLLLERLSQPEGLSLDQRAVARWLVRHRDDAGEMTVRQAAAAAGTSPTTVVRLAKRLGYDGFDALRKELAAKSDYLNRNYRGVDANRPFSPADSPLRVATKVCSLAQETARDTLALIEPAALEHAVALVDRARAIHVGAVSFPLLYAQDFQLKMNRVGKPVVVTPLAGEPLFTANLVQPDDVALVISYSGTTPATLDVARMYRRRDVPVVAVTSMAEQQLQNGDQDFIGLGRPLLADPDWVAKARDDRAASITRCIGCLYCMDRFSQDMLNGSPIECAVNPHTCHEAREPALRLDGGGRTVLVVGAGVAGLHAAKVLATRGFDVTVYERANKPGGQVNLADKPPHKGRLAWCVEDLVRQATDAGAKIVCDFPVSAETIIEANPYAVLLAVGSDEIVPSKVAGFFGQNNRNS